MRSINHAVTGALIGFTVVSPIIAIPLAIASHFALDAIPHFDFIQEKSSKAKDEIIKSRNFIGLLIIDSILSLSLVSVLAYSHPVHWQLASICAFLAAAPDLFSTNRFIKVVKNQSWKPNAYQRFAGKIQWFERPIGIVVEAAWFIGFIFCLSIFIRH